tara:strand:- start:319 stop:576 length:258 start_codon:yes stop_codon:yes gene_type:complete
MKGHPITKSLEAASSYIMGFNECCDKYDNMYMTFAREYSKKKGISPLEFKKEWDEFKRKESLVAWEYFHHKAKRLFIEPFDHENS